MNEDNEYHGNLNEFDSRWDELEHLEKYPSDKKLTTGE